MGFAGAGSQECGVFLLVGVAMSPRLVLASLLLTAARRLRRLTVRLLCRGWIGNSSARRSNTLANHLSRAGLRLAFAHWGAAAATSAAADGEERPHPHDRPSATPGRASAETRLTLWRIGMTILAFTAVSAILPPGRFWEFAGSMPFLLAVLPLVLAVILRERFAAPSLNRWDEATTLVAMGLALRIVHRWLA